MKNTLRQTFMKSATMQNIKIDAASWKYARSAGVVEPPVPRTYHVGTVFGSGMFIQGG